MSIDEELRQALADPSRSLPSWPDATARVWVGVRRRRARRRWQISATVAALTAMVLIVPAVLTHRTASLPATTPSGGSTVVPWKNAPGVVPASTDTSGLKPALVSARPCTAADLPSVTLASRDSAPGVEVFVFAVMNVATSRCALAGYPTLYSRDSQGRRTAVPVVQHTRFFGTSPDTEQSPAVVPPGDSADFRVVLGVACANPVPNNSYPNLTLTVAGRELPVADVRLSGTCPITVDPWFRELSMPAIDDTNDPLTNLQATISHIPVTVTDGTILDYVVTLTNPIDAAVSLDRCPVYQQRLDQQTEALTLNCAAAPQAIPGHGSVSFAMRIAASGLTPGKGYLVTWQLQRSAGAFAVASAGVTAG